MIFIQIILWNIIVCMKSNEQEKSFSLVFYRLEEVQLVSALELWPFPDTHNELRALIGPWHNPKNKSVIL